MVDNVGSKRKASQPEVDLDDAVFDLTDTEAAIVAIVGSEDGGRACRGVLVHQLYAMLSNKTSVDSEILTLRLNRGIKLLQFQLSDATLVTESQFVMPFADYEADLSSKLAATQPGSAVHASLTRFIPLAMKYLDKLSILESDLTTARKGTSREGSDSAEQPQPSLLSAEDIEHIVAAGFLCRRRDLASSAGKVLWFSHPILGQLRQWIDSSRKEILGMVRSTRYKEVSERDMAKKRALQSPLGLRYHLFDCVGAELLYCTQGPKGRVYRLSSLKTDT